MREQQEKEIATIKERTFKLRLSDEDIKRLWKKARKVGMTASELLTSFIGDLVDGTYSNGSDERMYAEQWFDRCCLSYVAEKTFLRYLLENFMLDYFLELFDSVKNIKEDKVALEKELQVENYPWEDILLSSKEHPQGVRCYNSKEDWQNKIKEELEQVEVELSYQQENINEIWNEFLEWSDNENYNQETEIKVIQDWVKSMQLDDTESEESNQPDQK